MNVNEEYDEGYCCAGCKHSQWYMGSAVICCHPTQIQCACDRMKDYSEICDKYEKSEPMLDSN